MTHLGPIACSYNDNHHYLGALRIPRVYRTLSLIRDLPHSCKQEFDLQFDVLATSHEEAKQSHVDGFISKILGLKLEHSSTIGVGGYREKHFVYSIKNYQIESNVVRKIVFRLSVFCTTGSVTVFAPSHGLASKIAEKFSSDLDAKIQNDNKIVLTFWRLANPNPVASSHALECPYYEEIESNYSKVVKEGYRWLTSVKDPHRYGKIVLWHGPPGTGKTWLIRALCRYWYKTYQCTPEVILDPEAFFADSNYIHDLILETQSGKPRLIIIEDHAELFSLDCRNRSGFSRLLNLTDGLIGQGQKFIFLFTANERIDTIDDAVRRNGRCLQSLYFDGLSPDEIEVWAEKNQVDFSLLEKGQTLADLYAIKLGLNRKEPEMAPSRSLGFME